MPIKKSIIIGMSKTVKPRFTVTPRTFQEGDLGPEYHPEWTHSVNDISGENFRQLGTLDETVTAANAPGISNILTARRIHQQYQQQEASGKVAAEAERRRQESREKYKAVTKEQLEEAKDRAATVLDKYGVFDPRTEEAGRDIRGMRAQFTEDQIRQSEQEASHNKNLDRDLIDAALDGVLVQCPNCNYYSTYYRPDKRKKDHKYHVKDALYCGTCRRPVASYDPENKEWKALSPNQRYPSGRGPSYTVSQGRVIHRESGDVVPKGPHMNPEEHSDYLNQTEEYWSPENRMEEEKGYKTITWASSYRNPEGGFATREEAEQSVNAARARQNAQDIDISDRFGYDHAVAEHEGRFYHVSRPYKTTADRIRSEEGNVSHIVPGAEEGTGYIGETEIRVARPNPTTGEPPPRIPSQGITKSLNKTKPHKYGCLMATIPAKLSSQITSWAKESIWEKHLGPGGLETESHITVKYGFKDSDPETLQKLKELLSKQTPFRVKLTTLSLFKNNEDGDVLKVDIYSPELRELNRQISTTFPCEDKYPNYQPHLTIAYLDPIHSHGYALLNPDFLWQEVVIDTLEWSGTDGHRETIKLSAGRRGKKSEPDPRNYNRFQVVELPGGVLSQVRDTQSGGRPVSVDLGSHERVHEDIKDPDYHVRMEERYGQHSLKDMSAMDTTRGGALVAPPAMGRLSKIKRPKSPIVRKSIVIGMSKAVNEEALNRGIDAVNRVMNRPQSAQNSELTAFHRGTDSLDPKNELSDEDWADTFHALRSMLKGEKAVIPRFVTGTTDDPNHPGNVTFVDTAHPNFYGGRAYTFLGDEEQEIRQFTSDINNPDFLQEYTENHPRVRSPAAEQEYGQKGNYFAECERDETGHCLPRGQHGDHGKRDKPSGRGGGPVQVEKPKERAGTSRNVSHKPKQVRVRMDEGLKEGDVVWVVTHEGTNYGQGKVAEVGPDASVVALNSGSTGRFPNPFIHRTASKAFKPLEDTKPYQGYEAIEGNEPIGTEDEESRSPYNYVDLSGPHEVFESQGQYGVRHRLTGEITLQPENDEAYAAGWATGGNRIFGEDDPTGHTPKDKSHKS